MPRRRSPGEGSITRRADGRWMARLELGIRDGKRARKYLYGTTRREVAAALTAAQAAQAKGRLVSDDRLTVGAYFDHWLATVVRHQVAASTLESYAGLVANHLAPALAAVRLGQLAARDLATLYARLLDAGRSPATVRKIHAVIHRALDQARRWGLVERNVADDVDRPRLDARRRTPLTEAQVETFLLAAESSPLWALYVLALTSGARQGELLGLIWAAVDWPGRAIRIIQQARRTKAEGLVLVPPKSEHGRRLIPVPGWALAALAWHRDQLAAARAAAGGRWEDHDLVFPNGVGRPIERHNLMRRSFRPLARAAGLPPSITFHDLRHSNATLLLSRGVHPKVVQERLGHSSFGVTMDIYSHVLPGIARAAADSLDDLAPGRLATEAALDGTG